MGKITHIPNGPLVDSQLSSQGPFTAYVKNSKWDNYAVEFDVKQLVPTGYGLGILVRRQSDTNYVALRLRESFGCGSRWVIVKEGNETVVVNSELKYDCAGHYRIEVQGSRYKLFKDGSELFVFNNNAFANGGVGLKSQDDSLTFAIEKFKVVRLR